MERILALQGLSGYSDSELVPPKSETSQICSTESGSGGRSGCSIGCGEAEEMDW